MLEKDDYYVPRHEWEKSRGRIHERINEVDAQHKDNYRILERRIDKQTLLQEQSLKEQSETNKGVQKLNTTMEKFTERVVDLEYKTKSNLEDIEEIRSAVQERKKDSVQIWVAVIGAIAVLGSAAIGLAQFM